MPIVNAQNVVGICLSQAAHFEHVLFVMAAVDDRAGAEEQKPLEERVRRQVEHGHAEYAPTPSAMTM